MAKKDDEAAVKAAEEEAAKKKAEEEAEAKRKAEEEAAKKAKAAGSGKAELFSVDELAVKNRIPTWQAAALHRFMGWAPGKKVTEAEYTAALENLNKRPQGGGRR